MHFFFFFFLSEYLSHLLFLQLFVLSAHGGELLGGGANGGGVSHTPQVFLHFFSFLSEYHTSCTSSFCTTSPCQRTAESSVAQEAAVAWTAVTRTHR